jgi:hypothetical protein
VIGGPGIAWRGAKARRLAIRMPRNNQIAANERSNMSIWRLLTRLVVGGFVFGHGTQRLFGWFG